MYLFVCRRLEADVRTRSPRQMTKQHSEASSGDRYLSRQESTGSCLSNNSTSSEGDMFNACECVYLDFLACERRRVDFVLPHDFLVAR